MVFNGAWKGTRKRDGIKINTKPEILQRNGGAIMRVKYKLDESLPK